MGQCTTKKAQIVNEILAYLSEHPDAQDTLEGIVRWWLLEQEIKRERDKVKEALNELVNRGLVIERKGSNTQVRYLINRDKLKEIQELLKKGAERDD
ncbi:MAG TPA: hypothetical protein VHT73_02680 [Thermodesulfobacteriota bacterium]|nr:hypothetical protein [Thermodesulfobacteriota bacterium]